MVPRLKIQTHTILKTLTLLPLLANRARMAMDSMQPLHGRPSAASVEVGMVSVEATEPMEAAGVQDRMEEIVVQDNGTEASHGTTMEDISMDERAAIVEGTETCQGELTIEDGSVGNGTIDADGAQSHGAERVSGAQGAQMVGRHLTSMVSGGIAGAGSQLGA